MNKFILPLVGFLALAIVMYVGVKNSPNRSTLTSVLIGRQAPEFTLPSLANPAESISTKQLLGKPWVLNVWATWCVSCRVEHQTLMEISKLGQAPLVGLNWKDDNDLAHQWLNQLGNPYSHIAVDHDGRKAIDWGVYGAPETFLIGADGKVQYRLAGPMTHEIWEREFLTRIQGKTVATP